ncbi:hypothetical protein B5X24_HaOG205043 [Helicoverpa armigera]|nr:hypothetical protein B5X24_HaOG205043 [Helicoverpa armigera]
MTQFLWSIGKLVNDPSAALFHELRQRLFRTSQEEITHAEEVPTSTSVVCSNVRCIELADTSNSPFSRKPKQPDCSSVNVQVGSGIFTNRHASIQCRGTFYGKQNKYTSISSTRRADRGTGGSLMAVKKDATTRTMKLKICKQHRDVIAALQHWKFREKNYYDQPTCSKFSQLRSSFTQLISSLKVEKIQSVPHYIPPEQEMIRLYKSASLDLNVDYEVRCRRKRVPRMSQTKLKPLKIDPKV